MSTIVVSVVIDEKLYSVETDPETLLCDFIEGCNNLLGRSDLSVMWGLDGVVCQLDSDACVGDIVGPDELTAITNGAMPSHTTRPSGPGTKLEILQPAKAEPPAKEEAPAKVEATEEAPLDPKDLKENNVMFDINGKVVVETIHGSHTVSSVLALLSKKYNRVDLEGLKLCGGRLDPDDNFNDLKEFGRIEPFVVVASSKELPACAAEEKEVEDFHPGLPCKPNGDPLFPTGEITVRMRKERDVKGMNAQFEVMGMIIEMMIPPTATVGYVVKMLRQKSSNNDIMGLMFDGAFLDNSDDFFDFLFYSQDWRKPFVACLPNYHRPSMPIGFLVDDEWYREDVPLDATVSDFLEIAKKASNNEKLAKAWQDDVQVELSSIVDTLPKLGQWAFTDGLAPPPDFMEPEPIPFPIGKKPVEAAQPEPAAAHQAKPRQEPFNPRAYRAALDVQIAQFSVNGKIIEHPLVGLMTAQTVLEFLRQFYQRNDFEGLAYKGARIDDDDDFADFIGLSAKNPIEVITSSKEPIDLAGFASEDVEADMATSFEKVITPRFRSDPSLWTVWAMRKHGVSSKRECEFQVGDDPQPITIPVSEIDTVRSVIAKLQEATDNNDICSLYLDDAKLAFDDEFEDFVSYAQNYCGETGKPIRAVVGKPVEFYVAKKKFSVCLTDDATFGELLDAARYKLNNGGISTAWVDGMNANPLDVIKDIVTPTSVIDLRGKLA